ncbi:hypothetical protein ACFE04_007905 [Oxalis oulophora]
MKTMQQYQLFYLTVTTLIALIHSATHQSDIQALRFLKKFVDPNTIASSSYLSTWDFSQDPCESARGQYLGVLCTINSGNSTSRILQLELDGIGYDGFLTDSIGNLTELTVLDISKNKFRGPIPESITSLTKLTKLVLSDNYFTGGFLSAITNMKKLQILNLSHNNLTGTVPASITTLRRLVVLGLSNNAFTGRIPDLSGLWQLHKLDLGSNLFYGTIPKIPTALITLSLSHNLLVGHISLIKSLRHLRSLDLSDNRFSGSIDSEILTLAQLIHLNVSFNRFTTMEVAKFTEMESESQLQVLDVQENHLRGHLPVSLVTAPNLWSVNLAHNQFTGPIPREYGAKLRSPWRSLYLDHNFLTGTLPPQFNGVKLKGDLSYNCLKCPSILTLCHGAQKRASDCVGQDNGGRK